MRRKTSQTRDPEYKRRKNHKGERDNCWSQKEPPLALSIAKPIDLKAVMVEERQWLRLLLPLCGLKTMLLWGSTETDKAMLLHGRKGLRLRWCLVVELGYDHKVSGGDV